ncbi:MAG: Hemolysin, chromosomal [Syntrophorhabdus sp. PtaU1.Bin050]|nr:MAG: Hemolysin, chromosomal [Syntrophorhabdus sp. PtaU1.Bin050]
MGAFNPNKNNAGYINNKRTEMGATSGDWTILLNALGRIEGGNSYATVNRSGYLGIYQFAPFGGDILATIDFRNNIGGMLNATTNATFVKNPVAQELAAIMEFSGIPDITKPFTSKFTAIRNAFSASDKPKFDQMVDQTFAIDWVNGSGGTIETQTITLSRAGLSAAAHLVGEGRVAAALKEIYKQAYSQGVLISPAPKISLSVNGNYADGNGVAFSTYMILFQNFDIDPLIDATDGLNWTQFNPFAQQLIDYRKDKIINYLVVQKQEVAMSVSYGNTNYRDTIRSIMNGLGLATTADLNTINGQVVLAGLNNSKYTDKADIIFGLGNANNKLQGGGGDDYIYGGKGDDTLTGGKGDDYLIGGADFDTYYYTVGDGHDWIYDQDNTGKIIIKDQRGGIVAERSLGNFYKVEGGTNAWKNPNGVIEITHNSPWKIVLDDGGTIELGEDFESGDFGITLLDTPSDPVTNSTITGDFNPANLNDTLYDSVGNDRIEGKDGSDMLYGWQGGNDWFSGGSGRDGLSSGEGDDIIEGGTEGDLLFGAEGDDQLFGETKGEMEDLITAGETAPSINEQGDLISGGAGDDLLYGSVRNDALFGGAGSDLLVGSPTLMAA